MYRQMGTLFNQIETEPSLGYALSDDWEGCYAVHCGGDRYRVIWEVLDPIDDYTGVADQVVPVMILRVGPKTDSRGRTIYDS